MHVYVQKSTSTTLPRSSAGVRGGELSQPVAPSNSASRPSNGKSPASPEWRVRNKLMPPLRQCKTLVRAPVRRRLLAACGGLGPLRQDPIRADEVAGVAVGVALEVVLVLGLGLPEVAGRGDLRDDLAGPAAGCFDVRDRLLGDLPLLVVGVEDRRPIARPDVVALTVQRGRIMDLEEELEHVAVGGPFGIEDDLD